MTAGPGFLDVAVLRITGSRGEPVGLGFLVADQVALTCAHVVTAALGLDEGAAPAASARLAVDLPLAGPASPTATAGIQVWGPSRPSGGADVAVLRLDGPLPGARPVWLVEAGSQEMWGHPARVFGFPAGRPGGVWHAGVLRGRQAAGWVQVDLAAGGGYRVSAGFSGSPVWDEDLGGVVGMTAVAESGDPPVSYLIPATDLMAVWPELRALALPPCPFRGLASFQESDAAVFFGRQAESAELADVVAAERWTTLVGPSGCGKSSLAMAGVIPRRRAAGDCAAVIRPAHHASPLRALAAALLSLLEPELPETERLTKISGLTDELTERGLREVVSRILELRGGTRLLVVVDQFEELLDLPDAAVDELADVLFDQTTPRTVAVLATLRADLLEGVLAHPRLGPVAGKRLHALEPMHVGQLRDVIAKPLETVQGVRYEPALADRILADAGAAPGALPLLGFTLAELWQRRGGGLLTHRAYTELGGVSGALNDYAESAWKANVPAADEAAAVQLLTRLVRIPIGAAAATRRTARRVELGEDQWRIAQRLAKARLLVAQGSPDGTETVELAHEALITGWDRLAQQVATDRAFLDWRETVQHDMDRWERSGRDTDLLPTPSMLAGAQRWLAERGTDLSRAERDYLSRGRAHQRSRTRRRHAVIAVVCVLALTAAVAGVVSFQKRQQAARDAAITRSNDLAADAQALAHTDPGLAAQLAIAAYRAAPTSGAASQLYSTLDTPLDRIIGTNNSGVLRVAAQAHGPLAAAVADNGALRIWNIADPADPAPMATMPALPAGIALAPHRALLAGECAARKGLCLWSLADPRRPAELARAPVPADVLRRGVTITSIAISPDDTLLAATAEQGFTLLWSIRQPARPRLLADLPNPTSDPRTGLPGVAFSPRGDLLAETIQHGRTQLWSLADPAAPAKVAAIAVGYQAVAFSPDGRLMAGAGDTNLGLWKITDPAHPASITVSTGAEPVDLTTVAFSPDGTRLAYGGSGTQQSNSALCLLDVTASDLRSQQPDCTATGFPTTTLAYTASGVILTGGHDGAARLWRPATPQVPGAALDNEFTMAYSPDGHLMGAPLNATQDPSRSVGIWDLTAPAGASLAATLTLSDLPEEVAFAGSAGLVTVAHDGAVRLWNARDPRHPVQAGSLGTVKFPTVPTKLGGFIISPAVFSDDAGDLVTVQDGDRLHLWRVSGAPRATEAGSIPMPGPENDVGGISGDGRTAFIITGAGLTWWNIRDPAHPIPEGASRLDRATGGDLIATGHVVAATTGGTSDGKRLTLFDLAGEHPRRTATLPEPVGSNLALSRNDRLLAVGGTANDTITLWDLGDLAHPRALATVRAEGDISGVIFDPAAHLMADWTSDQVQLWDVRDPAAPLLRATIKPSGQVNVAAFSATGATLVVGGFDGTRFYDADPGRLADRLCAYTGNTITSAQARRYAPDTPYRKPCP